MSLNANNIILHDIRALGLGPDDVLVIHTKKKLNAEQLRLLQQEIQKQLWGVPLKAFTILHGDFNVGKTPFPQDDANSTQDRPRA